MQWGLVVGGVCVALLLAGVGVAAPTGSPVVATGAAGTSEHFSITATESTDVTDQTVTIEGTDYSVSTVGVYRRGDPIDVRATGPHRSYAVTLYDFDEGRIIQEVPVRGSERVSLESDCSSCEPGTYAAAAYDDSIKDIQLVVVSGYDVTLSIPGSAPTDATVTARIAVEQLDTEQPPNAVEVVIDSPDGEVRAEAVRDGDSYRAAVPLTALSTGEYRVYGVALGEDDIDEDRPEILGVSERRTIELTTVTPTVGEAEPDTVTVGDVADDTPSAAGTQVWVSNTTVQSISFASEPANGTVTVSEFSDPPGNLTAPAGDLLGVVDITASGAVRNESATLRMNLSAERVTDPERVVVMWYDLDTGRWEPLETTLVAGDASRVVVDARTPGFSLFAVVQEPEPTSTPTATPTPADTSEPGAITPTTPTKTVDEQSGFGVAAAVVSLLVVVLVVARRVRP